MRSLEVTQAADSAGDGAPRLLTAREAAALLGISAKRAYELAQRNELPWLRLGERSVRFPEAALRKWIAERSRLA